MPGKTGHVEQGRQERKASYRLAKRVTLAVTVLIDKGCSNQTYSGVVWMGCIVVAMTLSGCGRALVVTVVDQESGSPVADVVVEHAKPKQMLEPKKGSRKKG